MIYVFPDFPKYWIDTETLEVFGIKKKPLKFSDNGTGYLRAVFTNYCDDGSIVKKTMLLHRLIAEACIVNEDPLVRTEVNHINGNKYDNRPCNLEWCSPKENSQHAWKTGLANKEYAVHEATFVSPTGEVLHVRNLRKFSRDYSLDQSDICKLSKGLCKHVQGWTLYENPA